MKVIKSSGNLFRDLGFDREEAENLRVRAVLMAVLERDIRKSGLSQAAVARKLGVTQPRVSDLLRGKIALFSVDTLIAMLSSVGRQVHVRVSRPKAA